MNGRMPKGVGVGIMLAERDARCVPALGWPIGGGVRGVAGFFPRACAGAPSPSKGWCGARVGRGKPGKAAHPRRPSPALWGRSPCLRGVAYTSSPSALERRFSRSQIGSQLHPCCAAFLKEYGWFVCRCVRPFSSQEPGPRHTCFGTSSVHSASSQKPREQPHAGSANGCPARGPVQ